MKHVFLLLFSVTFSSFTIGQSSLPREVCDSLISVWEDESQPDSTRLASIYMLSKDGYLFSNPDSGRFFANKQLTFARNTGYQSYEASALIVIGSAFYITSDFENAVKYYEKAYDVYKNVDNQEGVAQILNNIANVYYSKGELTNATDYYERSLRIKESLGPNTPIAGTLNNLGVIYKSTGHYSKALRYLKKAGRLYDEMGGNKDASNVLNNIGLIYYDQGDYNHALTYQLKSLEISRKANDKIAQTNNLANIGVLYRSQGVLDKAVHYYREGLDLSREIGDKQSIAMYLGNIGVTYHEKKALDSAARYLNQALSIYEELQDKKGIAIILIELGQVAYASDNYSLALDHFRKSRSLLTEMGNVKPLITNLYSTGKTYSLQNKTDSALYYYHKALTIANEIGAPQEGRAASLELFRTYWELDSIKKASHHITSVLQSRQKDIQINLPVLSEKQKERYLNKMQPEFDLFYRFATKEKDIIPWLPDSAYNLSLLTKGLLLKSTVSFKKDILNSDDSSLIAVYNDWVALNRRIIILYEEGESIDALKQEADKIEESLAREVYSTQPKTSSIPSWTDIQKNLGSNSVAIEFIQYHESDTTEDMRYAAISIRKGSKHPELTPLCLESTLTKTIGNAPGSNYSYISRLYGSRDNPNEELYDLLWKDLEPVLENISHIYLSSTGKLHKLSFAPMATPNDKMMIDVFDIEMLTSTAEVLSTPKEKEALTTSIAAFGGVEYGTESVSQATWKPLEGTLKEIEVISSLMTSKNTESTKYFTDTNATEKAFKKFAPQYSIVHVATHGFFYYESSTINEQTTVLLEEDLEFRGEGSPVHFNRYDNPLMRTGLVFAGANNRPEDLIEDTSNDGILYAQEVVDLDLRNTNLVVLSACETGLGDIHGSEGVYGLQRAFKIAGVNTLIMSLWQVPDEETVEFMSAFYEELVDTKNVRTSFAHAQKTMRNKYDPYYWAAFILVQ